MSATAHRRRARATEAAGRRRWRPAGRLAGRRAALLAAAWLATAPAAAQVLVEVRDPLAFDRPESWAMKYFASVGLPTGFGPPRELAPGTVELALEGGWIPTLSEAERTVGFNGTKTEALNRGSLLLRPRLVVGLPRSLSLGVGLVPPVERNGVEASLADVALGRPLAAGSRWRLGLRAFGQLGRIRGDLTCDRQSVAAGDDRSGNPFLCREPSDDEQTVRALGLELSAARRPRVAGRPEPYVAITVSHLDLEFRVRARYAGVVDRSLLVTDGVTSALTAGLAFAPSPRLRLVGELFYSPLDVARPPATGAGHEPLVNARLLVSYRMRDGRAGGGPATP